jgi:SAM-dependent methyltransferase
MMAMDEIRAAKTSGNVDQATVSSFGDEWSRLDQSALPEAELSRMFEAYFHIFPWSRLPVGAQGFDMGCGSGRWARRVAPRVGRLNCIDPSSEALGVARKALAHCGNVDFILASADEASLPEASQDFGYSLDVLHHTPDTEATLKACAALLKPGAPLLVYLHYRFDNRPLWFRTIWRASELLRAVVSRLPALGKSLITDAVALLVYLPLARLAWLAGRLGVDTRNFPLQFYRNASFYTMRTDSRDRFGTPLEQRFTRAEITAMVQRAGCGDIVFSEQEPYWCAAGIKTP